MNRAGLWLLVAIILLPTVAAVSGEGEFLIEGGAFLPPESDLWMRPVALFTNNTLSLHDLRLVAPEATLTEYEERYAVVAGASGGRLSLGEPREVRAITLRNLDLRLSEADHRGILGVYPSAGAFARILPSSSPVVEGRAESRVGDEMAVDGSEGRRSDFYYDRILDEPHLLVHAEGAIQYEGRGALKLTGPDVLVAALDQSPFIVQTGERSTGRVAESARTALDETVRRWAVLEFSNGRLEMATRGEWVVAAKAVEAEWDGPALFTPHGGSLTTAQGTYVGEGRPVRLAGQLSGSFLPHLDGDTVSTRLEVAGEVEHTTLRLVEGPLGRRLMSDPDFQPLRLLLVGSVIGIGALAGGVSWFRRHPLPALPRRRAALDPLPFTVEDCMAAAADAADDEDWPRAAEWLVRVRRLAPTSARTCADLAHAYCQMGQWEDGLRMYDEASRLSTDGEADFNAAVVALENNLPVEEVEQRLVRALGRSPNYVVDVETDPSFAPLRGRPGFERIVREAWERADDVDASEGAPVRP